jgi:hypothetical protein
MESQPPFPSLTAWRVRETLAVGLVGPIVGAAVGAGAGLLAGQHPNVPHGAFFWAWACGVGGALGATLDSWASGWIGRKQSAADITAVAGAAFVVALLAGVLGGIVGGALDGAPIDLLSGALWGLLFGLCVGLVLAVVGGAAGKLLSRLGGGAWLLGLTGGAAAAVAAGFNYVGGRDEAQLFTGVLRGVAGGIGGLLGGLAAYHLRGRLLAKKPPPELAPRLRVPFAVALLTTAGTAAFLLAQSPLLVRIGQSGRAKALALSADGTRCLVSREETGTMKAPDLRFARLVDLQTGKVGPHLEGDYTVLNDIAFTPDGARAVGAAQSHDAFLWTVDSGKVLKTQKISVDTVTTDLKTGHQTFGRSTLPVKKVADLPGGKRALLVAGDEPNFEVHMVVWDLESGEIVSRIRAHKDEVRALSLTPDGRHALTASKDKTLIVWKIDPTARKLPALPGRTIEAQQELIAAALSPDARWAVGAVGGIGNRDYALRVWDAETRKEVRRIEGHAAPVTALAFLPDGRRVLSGSEDQTVRLWDLETGQELGRYNARGPVARLCIDRDGRRVLVAPETGALRLYSLP